MNAGEDRGENKASALSGGDSGMSFGLTRLNGEGERESESLEWFGRWGLLDASPVGDRLVDESGICNSDKAWCAVQSWRTAGFMEERLSARPVLLVLGARLREDMTSGERKPFTGRTPSSKDLRRGPRESTFPGIGRVSRCPTS